MPRIRFTRAVTIAGDIGPNGHESRLSFAEGEVVEVEEASRDHFVSRGNAVEVFDAPAPVVPPRPEPVVEQPAAPVPVDAGLEPASLPDHHGVADIAAPEPPVKRRPGRPRKEA